MFVIEPIRTYYHQKMDEIGPVLSQWKNFRNDVAFFQKVSIAGKASLDFMNHYRGTALLGRLTKLLGVAYLTDLLDVSSSLAYMKPINVDTVHKPALIERVMTIIELTQREMTDDVRKLTLVDLKEDLDAFLNELADGNQGQLFGFADSKQFLAAYQGFIIKKRRSGWFKEINLTHVINEVPLKKNNWAEWLTTKALQSIGVMTVVSYCRAWDFIDTAAWAASVGQVQGFNWVNNLDFNTAFHGLLWAGFGLAVVVVLKEVLARNKNNPEVSDSAKARAPYQLINSFAEASYFRKSFFMDLGLVKKNPLFSALSLFATKTVGMICTIETPAANGWDLPVSQATSPSVTNRISAKFSEFVAPITQQRHILKISEQVNHVATRALEFLNDFMNLTKDGYDKLYKIILPGLNLADMGLQAAKWTTGPIFKKCTSTLQLHKDLIYASKIFTVLPKYIVLNSETGHYTFVTPFYNYDKKQYQIYDGFCQFLLDTAALGDFCKFLRKNELYQFDQLVAIGNYLAERQISLFGYSAYVKEIPGLREINKSIKNFNIVIYATLRCAKQLWTVDFYETNERTNRLEFSFLKVADFAGNVGKFTICGFGVNDGFWSQLTCFLTGASGLTYSVRQYRARRRIEQRGAAYLL